MKALQCLVDKMHNIIECRKVCLCCWFWWFFSYCLRARSRNSSLKFGWFRSPPEESQEGIDLKSLISPQMWQSFQKFFPQQEFWSLLSCQESWRRWDSFSLSLSHTQLICDLSYFLLDLSLRSFEREKGKGKGTSQCPDQVDVVWW